MKKIGIDARLYSQTGVGTYLKNLLHYLDNSLLVNKYYIYLRKNDYQQVKFKNPLIIKKIADYQWHGLAEQTFFLIDLYRDDLDLMHFTYFSYPILYFNKFIATIHDLTPLFFKTGRASTKNKFIYEIKHLFFKLILYVQVQKSTQIITPTNTVKNQLITSFGQEVGKKISVTYEGVSYQIKATKESKQLSKKFNNFFIYVGNFYPHKNIEKLIQAFSKIKTDSKLLLIGPNDFFSSKILYYINIMKWNKKIIFIKNPSLSDLKYFYRNCLALIHPSLSEGFGLPLVEAAYFNSPIIASNIEVFKELLGNNYLSFNPNNADDIAKKINSFIEKKPKFDYSNIMKKYSFEKMTNETLRIYQRALERN